MEPLPASPPVGAPPEAGRRYLAKFIDGVVGALAAWLVAAVVPGWFEGALVGALAGSGYVLIADGLETGPLRRRSVGKTMTGLAARRLDGTPMGMAASARRNWMLALSFLPHPFTFRAPLLATVLSVVAFGLVAYEVWRVATAEGGRRWGDELAGTEVVQLG